MQAFEARAIVSEDHCIHVQVPDDWVDKKVRIVILRDDEELEPLLKREPIKLGLFRGQIEIGDNFNDELPDDFCLNGNQ